VAGCCSHWSPCWHLKLGELIAQSHAIPDTDLFSAVHPERAYVQLQWLWELLAYGAFQLGDLLGVRLMQVACMVCSFVVLGLVSLRIFGNRALTFAFCALALLLFEDRFQTRPSATALGFVACFLPCWLGLDSKRMRLVALLFVLAALWSNLHAGESLLAPLGMAALALGGTVERLLGAESVPERRRYLLLAAVTFGILMSPTLLPGMQSFSSAIQPQLATGNKEWRATYTTLENGFTPSFVIIGLGPTLLLVIYLIEQVRRVRSVAPGRVAQSLPVSEWLLCGGMFALSHQAVRNAFLCIVPLAFMLRRAAPALAQARARRLTILVALCLLLAAFDDHVLRGYGGVEEAWELAHQDLAPATFPEQLTEFMQEAGIEGGMLNDGRWGGYLIWKLWPRSHVFVDTRHDLTSEMWPVFMASHSPGTRPQAMREAFQRWRVELPSCRRSGG
jgi:hypothetical protein